MAESTPEQQQYPNLNPYANQNGNGSLQGAKDSVVNNASNTVNSISNSQTMQNLRNGPVADKARTEAAATSNEFSNLANARQTPSAQTATGQNLTHYHSLFYELLSWNNPRATAISFASTIIFIFVTRYVPVERYVLKALFTVLGITAAAEIAGKIVFDQGFASKLRPRKYYTIPRETLESMLGDVEELINFFVIEAQRIVFAENVYATIAAFFTALIGYFLVKVTPKWGLALISTTVIYLAPLIYIKNKDFIDGHLNNAHEIIGQQAGQVRDLAAHHSNRAMSTTSNMTKQYVGKAQEMMGQGKKTAVDQGYVSNETAQKMPGSSAGATSGGPTSQSSAPSYQSSAPSYDGASGATSGGVKQEDFPSAPSQEPPSQEVPSYMRSDHTAPANTDREAEILSAQ